MPKLQSFKARGPAFPIAIPMKAEASSVSEDIQKHRKAKANNNGLVDKEGNEIDLKAVNDEVNDILKKGETKETPQKNNGFDWEEFYKQCEYLEQFVNE